MGNTYCRFVRLTEKIISELYWSGRKRISHTETASHGIVVKRYCEAEKYHFRGMNPDVKSIFCIPFQIFYWSKVLPFTLLIVNFDISPLFLSACCFLPRSFLSWCWENASDPNQLWLKLIILTCRSSLIWNMVHQISEIIVLFICIISSLSKHGDILLDSTFFFLVISEYFHFFVFHFIWSNKKYVYLYSAQL